MTWRYQYLASASNSTLELGRIHLDSFARLATSRSHRDKTQGDFVLADVTKLDNARSSIPSGKVSTYTLYLPAHTWISVRETLPARHSGTPPSVPRFMRKAVARIGTKDRGVQTRLSHATATGNPTLMAQAMPVLSRSIKHKHNPTDTLYL
jgi:hypothetical protein